MRLIDFCRETWPRSWHINWHHELICENLELLERGEIPNLMLWAPPRHSKSAIATVYYPIYCLRQSARELHFCVRCSSRDQPIITRISVGLLLSDLVMTNVLPSGRTS